MEDRRSEGDGKQSEKEYEAALQVVNDLAVDGSKERPGHITEKASKPIFDPVTEDAYWRENYSKRYYTERGAPYTLYRQAYKVGYSGYGRHQGRSYEDVEMELRRQYERDSGEGLAWEKARYATRDAWDRVAKRHGHELESKQPA